MVHVGRNVGRFVGRFLARLIEAVSTVKFTAAVSAAVDPRAAYVKGQERSTRSPVAMSAPPQLADTPGEGRDFRVGPKD